jgi:hypothetical protein
MKVVCTVDTWADEDGPEGKHPDNIMIRTSEIDECVEVVVGKITFTVNGEDLKRAVDNAMNIGS